jgi:hypothetical protein
MDKLIFTQISELIELYKIELINKHRIEEDNEIKKRSVGRPKKFETPEERNKHHQEKLKAEKYSTKYYQKNKCRIECQYCQKDINNLAKTSHYKSKQCINSRIEPRVLVPQVK